MNAGSGKTIVGCVQHDCEKCKKQENLLAFLLERMTAIQQFADTSIAADTRLDVIDAIARACARRIRESQQS